MQKMPYDPLWRELPLALGEKRFFSSTKSSVCLAIPTTQPRKIMIHSFGAAALPVEFCSMVVIRFFLIEIRSIQPLLVSFSEILTLSVSTVFNLLSTPWYIFSFLQAVATPCKRKTGHKKRKRMVKSETAHKAIFFANQCKGL